MVDESAAILDDLLCRWHQWQQDRHRYGRGYPSRAIVCGECRISRQYDDANGALDDAVDHQVMRGLDFQVGEMRDPHKAAIYANARALVVGAAVWSSPRLPLDRLERAHIVAEARDQLVTRLHDAGIM